MNRPQSTTQNVIDLLRADAQALGLNIDQSALERLQQYLEQLARWNRTYNLTAIRDPEAMRVQHVVDSLSILPVLDRIFQDMQQPQVFRVMDVGSGGGLPGVVIAVLRPEWQVSCVDAVAKKTTFIRQVASVLRLSNLQACHARVEELDVPQCQVVVSRAFASLVDFANLAGKHVAPEGVLLAMKGRQPDEELHELAQSGLAWQVTHIEPLLVPGLDAERCAVWLRHASPS